MTTGTEAAAEGGEQTFEREFEAARLADETAPTEGAAAEGGAEAAAAPEGEAAAEAAALAPLSPEELQKRLNDQQGATRQERQRRRQLEQANRQLEERLQALEQGRQATTGAEGQPEPRPNPEEDPVGYMKWLEGMLSRAEERQAQEAQQTQAQQQAAKHVEAIVTRVAGFESDFRETNPDYDQAADHLYNAKKAEYVEAGYSDEDAHTAVMGEFLTRSKRALESGKDPAEIVYSMAKRAGFQSKAGERKLDTIEQGQRRANPMAGGGGNTGELSIEAISNLKGAAFDAAFAKLQERAEAQGW